MLTSGQKLAIVIVVLLLIAAVVVAIWLWVSQSRKRNALVATAAVVAANNNINPNAAGIIPTTVNVGAKPKNGMNRLQHVGAPSKGATYREILGKRT